MTDIPQSSDPSSKDVVKTTYVLVPRLDDPVKNLVRPYEKMTSFIRRSDDDVVEEILGLAHAIRLDVIGHDVYNVKRPSPGTLFGKGQCEAIGAYIEEHKPDVVIVNHALSPIQQRNLEKKWQCKVIDRTGLILEIFGDRAQTKEGKLQVELASLKYAKSRLVRSWTHLERQRGGLGFVGGPGETQLEIDKRLISERIQSVEKDLEHVRKTRSLQRKNRQRRDIPVISLVGYTNAGKSTLFNTLTGADIFAKDLLFATLDPTTRQIDLPKIGHGSDDKALISDTVGFISDLPTDLIAAFRATLEQIQFADIIVHVRDIESQDSDIQKADVINVLETLGISYHHDERVIEVWNKIDKLAIEDQDNMILKAQNLSQKDDTPSIIAVSAVSGIGCDELKDVILQKIRSQDECRDVFIPHRDGKALAWLYDHGHILSKDLTEEGGSYTVELSAVDWNRFYSLFPDRAHDIITSSTITSGQLD